MKNQSLFLFAAFIAYMFFASCKKQDQSHNNNTTSLQCRITDIKIIGQVNSEIILGYNSDKKLSSVIYTQPKKQDLFSYSRNLIIKKELDSNGNLLMIDTIVLGANNLVNTTVSRYAPTGDIVKLDTMTYNAQDQLIKSLELWPTIAAQSYNYTWTNGDAVTIGARGATPSAYYYYTDKNIADGDFRRIDEILTYGAYVFKCKHLFKGEQGPENINYRFDSSGKITSVIENRAMDSTVYNYGYACD